jgi:hypothetical protein
MAGSAARLAWRRQSAISRHPAIDSTDLVDGSRPFCGEQIGVLADNPKLDQVVSTAQTIG